MTIVFLVPIIVILMYITTNSTMIPTYATFTLYVADFHRAYNKTILHDLVFSTENQSIRKVNMIH